ncbi:MAG: hypothetical protein ACSHX6_07170 [Akkermansiaceae bacterium]
MNKLRLGLLVTVSLVSGFGLQGCADGGATGVPAVSRSTKVADMPVAYDDPGIFKKYDSLGDSVMNTTWTRKFDASGISFNDKRTCTLVTQQHVVMASHYKRPVPSSVVFHDRNGKRIERVLVSARNVHGDCAVGLLNEPVPAGYKVYPLLAPAEGLEERLKGEFVLVTDQNKRVFVHEVARIVSDKMFLRYDPEKKLGYGKMLVSGDSGNPSFIMVNGEPVLVETHLSGGAGAGPFYGSAVLIEKLKATISALGGAGSVRVVRF